VKNTRYHISKDKVNINNTFPLSTKTFTYPQAIAINLHTHDFCEIGITVGGMANHVIGGTKSRLIRGSIYIIPKGMSHKMQISDKWKVINIYFLPELIVQNLDTLIRTYGVFPVKLLGFMNSNAAEILITYIKNHSLNCVLDLIKCMEDSPLTGGLSQSMFSKNCFMNILMIFAENFRSNNGCFTDRRIIRIILDVHDNYFLDTKEIINLISKNLKLTPQYVNTIFFKEMECNISEYIIKSKILRSCSILLDQRNSVTDVAIALAFYDHSHFIKYFKKHIGLSPSDYIQKHTPTI